MLILDIDGVLITNPPWKADKIHTDGYSEFNNSCVENLNQLLATNTFDIWLSSSRRSSKTLVEFNRIFENRGIDGHITGYLPSCPTCKNRLDEVLNFIDIYHPTDYLIIDDDKSLNALETPLKTHLILTDLSTGFSFEKLQEAIQKTTSKHR